MKKHPPPMISDHEWLRFLATMPTGYSDECWNWPDRKPLEYPLVCVGGKRVRASWVSWVVANNSYPLPGYIICHTCDNPNCVNPSHLYVGTHLENANDRFTRKRKALVNPIDEVDAEAKLFWRRSIVEAGSSIGKVAKRMGVSTSHLSRQLSLREGRSMTINMIERLATALGKIVVYRLEAP